VPSSGDETALGRAWPASGYDRPCQRRLNNSAAADTLREIAGLLHAVVLIGRADRSGGTVDGPGLTRSSAWGSCPQGNRPHYPILLYKPQRRDRSVARSRLLARMVCL